MFHLIKQMFTWWNGSTFSMRLYTRLKGNLAGVDEFGNKYYEGKSKTKDGNPRRWVIYKNYSDASMIPPGWHGWMHYRYNTPPTQQNYTPYSWEKTHLPNLTGTDEAYTPKGSIRNMGQRNKVTGDYSAWDSDTEHKKN